MNLRHYRLALPAGLKLLNANQRVHYRVRHEATAAIRDAAMVACSEDDTMRAALQSVPAGEPLLRHAWIIGVYHPATNRRADPANWYPSFKAAVDGLVDAGVLEDDDHTHLIGPDMRIGDRVQGSQIELHIFETTGIDTHAWRHLTSNPATQQPATTPAPKEMAQ